MQLDYGHIETKGLSLHLHGWLRADTGDGGYYDEDTDGELLYGYVEYMPPSNGFNLKVGREHPYEAALTLESLLLKPVYQSYRFEDYFTEDNTDFHPFRFLQKTEEKLVIIGADVARQQNPGFDAGIRFKQYDYDQRNETSRYMAVILNFYANDATRYGLEGGIMDGESSDNRYRLGQGYIFWSRPFGAAESWFMSSDILFIQYNEDIYGKDVRLKVVLKYAY